MVGWNGVEHSQPHPIPVSQLFKRIRINSIRLHRHTDYRHTAQAKNGDRLEESWTFHGDNIAWLAVSSANNIDALHRTVGYRKPIRRDWCTQLIFEKASDVVECLQRPSEGNTIL